MCFSLDLGFPEFLVSRYASWMSTQLRTRGPGFKDRLVKHRHVRKWHLVHVKSVVDAIYSKFPFKL